MDNEFDGIVLLKLEQRTFRRFTDNNVVSMPENDANHLIRFGLIHSENIKVKGKYVLTDTGKRYKEFVRQNRIERITTRAIAITALALSALSIAATIWIAIRLPPQ